MPYSGAAQHVHKHTKFAWARLNADALFLALYAAFAGLVGIIHPDGPIVRSIGYATPSYYMVHAGYLAAGLLLLLALMKELVSLEVIARVTLLWAVAFQIARLTAFYDGWWPESVTTTIIFGIVGSTTLLRFSVLLSKKGIVVHLPQRHPDTEDSDS